MTTPVLLPIPIVVTRHQCPHCGRTRSKKTAAAAHMGRCWWNPDARACKTCTHFTPADPDGPYPEHPGWPEACGAGQDITAGLASGCPQWQSNREPTPTAPPLPPWEETLAEVIAWDRWWGEQDDNNNDEIKE